MPKTKKPDEEKIKFLTEAYKLRAQLYGDLTNRMWSRFNYLLTANVAAVSIFFNFWVEARPFSGTIWFPIIGIIISFVWFVLGSQDRYYFEGFRAQIQQVERAITDEIGITNPQSPDSGAESIGNTDDPAWPWKFGTVRNVETDSLTRRWKFASLSRLPALVPLLFILIWGLILVIAWLTVSTQGSLSSVQFFV